MPNLGLHVFPGMNNYVLYLCYAGHSPFYLNLLTELILTKEIFLNKVPRFLNWLKRQETDNKNIVSKYWEKKMEVALGLAYQRSGILIKNASNLIWNGLGIIPPFG